MHHFPILLVTFLLFSTLFCQSHLKQAHQDSNMNTLCLIHTLCSIPDATIQWPEGQDFQGLNELIVQCHPLLGEGSGAFCSMDGLKLAVQVSDDPNIENMTYNGWLHGVIYICAISQWCVTSFCVVNKWLRGIQERLLLPSSITLVAGMMLMLPNLSMISSYTPCCPHTMQLLILPFHRVLVPSMVTFRLPSSRVTVFLLTGKNKRLDLPLIQN